MKEIPETQCIRWFLKELQQLRQKGLLSSEQSQSLEELYTARQNRQNEGHKRRRAYFIRVTALVFLSVFFFVSRFLLRDMAQIICISTVMFSGIVLGGYVLLKKPENLILNELAPLMVLLGFSSLTWCTSEMYHTGLTTFNFIWVFLTVCIFLIYLFRSASLIFLFSGGCVFLAVCTMDLQISAGWNTVELIFAELFPLFAVPFAIRDLEAIRDTGRTLFLRYALLPCFAAYLLFPFSNRFPVFIMVAVMSRYGFQTNEIGVPVLRNPWLTIGFLLETFLLLLGGTWGGFWTGFPQTPVVITLTVGISLLFLWMFARKFYFMPELLIFLLFILLPLPGMLLPIRWMMHLSNIFMLLSGTVFFYLGLRRLDRFEIFAGITQMVLPVLYLPSTLTLLWRAGGTLLVLTLGWAAVISAEKKMERSLCK